MEALKSLAVNLFMSVCKLRERWSDSTNNCCPMRLLCRFTSAVLIQGQVVKFSSDIVRFSTSIHGQSSCAFTIETHSH